MQIARTEGVAPATVSRATSQFGPFPPTVTIRTRTEQTHARAGGWARRRRAGESVAEIAVAEGISVSVVRQGLRPFRPFGNEVVDDPRLHSTAVVAEWVSARHAGVSLTRLSEQTGLSTDRLRRVTSSGGPYPFPSRHDAGLLNVGGIAALAGMPRQVVTKWTRSPGFPAPVARTPRGGGVWRVKDVSAWMDTSGLDRCPTCGARVKSLSRHVTRKHGRGQGQHI